MQVVTADGVLRVPLLAQRPPPALTLPALVDVGPALVGGTLHLQLPFRNAGGAGTFRAAFGAGANEVHTTGTRIPRTSDAIECCISVA